MVVVVRRFGVGTGKMRRWVGSKPIGAMSTAEVVGMPLMLVAGGGRLRIYRHSAHGIGLANRWFGVVVCHPTRRFGFPAVINLPVGSRGTLSDVHHAIECGSCSMAYVVGHGYDVLLPQQ